METDFSAPQMKPIAEQRPLDVTGTAMKAPHGDAAAMSGAVASPVAARCAEDIPEEPVALADQGGLDNHKRSKPSPSVNHVSSDAAMGASEVEAAPQTQGKVAISSHEAAAGGELQSRDHGFVPAATAAGSEAATVAAPGDGSGHPGAALGTGVDDIAVDMGTNAGGKRADPLVAKAADAGTAVPPTPADAGRPDSGSGSNAVDAEPAAAVRERHAEAAAVLAEARGEDAMLAVPSSGNGKAGHATKGRRHLPCCCGSSARVRD